MKNQNIRCYFSRSPDPSELQQFNSFVESCCSQTFMQSSDWLKVYTPTRLQNFAYVWCVDDDGGWLAAGLIRLTKVFKKRYIGSFLRGPVSKKIEGIDRCLPVMMSTLRDEGVFTLMLNPHWEGEQAEQLSQRLLQYGFTEVPLVQRTSHSTTAGVDLTPSEEDIFASFRGRCRRNIRTAVKKGVVLREASNKCDALGVQRIQERMAQVKNMDTAGIPDVAKLFGVIQDKQQGTIMVAELDGEIIGGIGMVKEGRRAYMQIVAISPDYPKIPQSSILYWESMKLMKLQGCDFYDFVGFPEGGIEHARDEGEQRRAHFKLEFNPVVIKLLPVYVKSLRPLCHLVLFNARQRYLRSSLRRYLIPFLKGKAA